METVTIPTLNKTIAKSTATTQRVIQFGTGVLLRGLIDYAINKANHQNIFNGSIVQIKSTKSGSLEQFTEQDNCFTTAIRGMQNNALVEQYVVNTSISSSMDANTAWQDVIALATVESIDIIVSNTTEVGLSIHPTDAFANEVPVSFPAKLLAILKLRYDWCQGNTALGYTIVPTELITNNGNLLQSLVLELAEKFEYEAAFIEWIKTACTFCNSLVDRIVTGTPTNDKLEEHYQKLGYKDSLLIECEPYMLSAIEGNEAVQKKLSFATEGSGVVITNDITKFKELKLRLLNGTHSFMCAYAFLHRFGLVREALNESAFVEFVQSIMYNEIAPTLAYEKTEVEQFANDVLQRFLNPFIDHKWHNISLNYTQKMAMRNVETIQRYYAKFGKVPQQMATCFAYYIKFMKVKHISNNTEYYGFANNAEYIINDPAVNEFYVLQEQYSNEDYIKAVLANKHWWSVDLNELEGFTDAVWQTYSKL